MAGATLPPSSFKHARSRHRWTEHGIETIEPPLRARPIWPLAILAATLALSLMPLQHGIVNAQRAAAENGLVGPDLLLSSVSGVTKVTGSEVASKR
jgi:hypothetical protein